MWFVRPQRIFTSKSLATLGTGMVGEFLRMASTMRFKTPLMLRVDHQHLRALFAGDARVVVIVSAAGRTLHAQREFGLHAVAEGQWMIAAQIVGVDQDLPPGLLEARNDRKGII